MERPEFLHQLERRFPDAFAAIDDIDGGLLHCEMAAFRRHVERKMDEGAAWYCEQAVCFVERCLRDAGPALENAIEVSFIEDLALGEHNRQRHAIVTERAPRAIRDKMIQVHDFWKQGATRWIARHASPRGVTRRRPGFPGRHGHRSSGRRDHA